MADSIFSPLEQEKEKQRVRMDIAKALATIERQKFELLEMDLRKESTELNIKMTHKALEELGSKLKDLEKAGESNG